MIFFSCNDVPSSTCAHDAKMLCTICTNAVQRFYARQQELLYRVLAIAILSVCLSVCPSVRHTGGSGKNGAS